jgi:hypothetical protein
MARAGHADEQVVERCTADAAGSPPGNRVALTALGDWYTRPLVEERGYGAPLADDWAEASAATLLEAAAEVGRAGRRRGAPLGPRPRAGRRGADRGRVRRD